jgi:hypothetical protein
MIRERRSTSGLVIHHDETAPLSRYPALVARKKANEETVRGVWLPQGHAIRLLGHGAGSDSG